MEYNSNYINYIEPLNPLGLPGNTIRVKMLGGYTPGVSIADKVTLVDSQNNVWDIYKKFNYWDFLFTNDGGILEVLGANTTNVTSMDSTFQNCRWLSSVSLFDTSNLVDAESMFRNCMELTSIPLYDTSKVSNMNYMFSNCFRVQSGALALYQQASTQTTPPSGHTSAFKDCGYRTQTGSAELAQIPSDWK
jgi:surface protein